MARRDFLAGSIFSQSWADIILFYSVDESEALNKFFELFEKFMYEENAVTEKLVQDKLREETAPLSQETVFSSRAIA